MSRRRRSKHYDVGYGRPPVHTQFRRGVSGNPKGRPKSSRNFTTELAEELNETILVREGGVEKRMSKLRAVVKRLVEGALRSEPRALYVLAALARSEAAAEGQPGTTAPLTGDDQIIIDRYLARHAKK
jgi:hypothetical protein